MRLHMTNGEQIKKSLKFMAAWPCSYRWDIWAWACKWRLAWLGFLDLRVSEGKTCRAASSLQRADYTSELMPHTTPHSAVKELPLYRTGCHRRGRISLLNQSSWPRSQLNSSTPSTLRITRIHKSRNFKNLLETRYRNLLYQSKLDSVIGTDSILLF